MGLWSRQCRLWRSLGVLKQQIESKTGAKLSPSDNITPWMVRWAAILCSKYIVGNDGRTP